MVALAGCLGQALWAFSYLVIVDMVGRCVVFGCGGIPVEKEVSVHEFPPASNPVRTAWVRFVRRTRDKWTPPSGVIYICSRHFVDESYINIMQYRMGLSLKLLLRKDSVPLIYPDVDMGRPPPLTTATVSQGPMRSAARKREAHRVSAFGKYID